MLLKEFVIILEKEREYKTKKSILKFYEDVVKKIKEVIKDFERKLKFVSRKAPNTKILIDIKTADSFLDKVIKRGKHPEKITDVLRSAILVRDKDDVDKVAIEIHKKLNVIEHEYKTPENTQGGYYGAHHFLISLDNNIIAEVQLMTKRLWNAKEYAHIIYSKYRSANKDEIDLEQKRRDEVHSAMLFKYGNRKKSFNKYKEMKRKGF